MGRGFWSMVGYRFLFNRFTLLLAAAVSAWATWTMTRTPDDPRAAIRDILLDSAAERIAALTPAQIEGRPVAVAQLGGDPDGVLTQGLRLRLGADRGRPVPAEFLDKVRRQVGLQGKPIVTLEDALRVARESGVAATLFGDVTDQRLGDRAGTLAMDLRWAEVSTNRSIYLPPVTAEIDGPRSYMVARAAHSAIWPRLLIWLGVSLFLPVVASSLIRWLTARESNALNLAVLIALTAADALLAFGLMGFAASSALTALALVSAFGLAASYNYVAVGLINEYMG